MTSSVPSTTTTRRSSIAPSRAEDVAAGEGVQLDHARENVHLRRRQAGGERTGADDFVEDRISCVHGVSVKGLDWIGAAQAAPAPLLRRHDLAPPMASAG
jgi:hypothetical protein